MSVFGRVTADQGVGALLLLLGGGSLVEAFRIKDDWSGAKLMPVVAAVALLAVGVAHVAQRPRPQDGTMRPELSRVGVVVAVLVAYVAALPALGFLLTTVALLLVLIRGIGGYRWPAALGLAIGLGAACHVVFRVWLTMPLPDGLLPF